MMISPENIQPAHTTDKPMPSPDLLTMAKPLFVGGMFNHAQKRIHVKYIKTVRCEDVAYDLYIRNSKNPDVQYPRTHDDMYYLYVLQNDWLIHIGHTEWELRHRAVQAPLVAQLYGTEEGRKELFHRFHTDYTNKEADRLIVEQIAIKEKMEEKLGMDDTYMAVYIQNILDQHIQTYLDCKNGIGTFPDFVGAVLVNELDTCIGLSKIKKQRDQQKREEQQKRAEEEARLKAEDEARENAAALKAAEVRLLQDGKIVGSQQLCALAEKYGIQIPIRTKGWILHSFVSCHIQGEEISVQYQCHKNRSRCQKIFDIIREIQKAVENTTDRTIEPISA